MANIYGNALNNILTGGGANDRLYGYDGADQLNGGNGSDRLWGGEGNDILDGGAGSDYLYGENGADTLLLSTGFDRIDGGAGNDTLDFTSAATGVTATLGGSYSAGAGSTGTITAVERLLGGQFADTLTGDAGANRLDGAAGNDVLDGALGNDELWGGRGSDVLIANGGNDYLNGDYSALGDFDNAADTYVVATSSGTVTVSTFTLGVDKLDLSHFGFDANGVSAYWSGSAVQAGYDTVLTLGGQNGEVVTIVLEGLVYGHQLSTADMINGSASLIAPGPLYPANGGNGVQDIHAIMPGNGDITILNFEDGLDLLDISGFIGTGWDGYLGETANGSAILTFFDGQGNDFTVTLEGVGSPLIDSSDYIM